jgi:signal transduction histidine kinase
MLSLAWLPPERSSGPVQHSPRLDVLVGVVTAAAVLAAVPALVVQHDAGVTALLGGAAVFLVAATAVSALSGVNTHWSASGLLHLGLTLALGPAGALAAAAGEAGGTWLRYRSGWFRALVNVDVFVLSNLGAWLVFRITTEGRSGWAVAVAGVAAGATQWLINHLLLAAVISAAAPGVRFLSNLRAGFRVLPYNLGNGWAAFGAVLLHRSAGTLGLSAFLVPVVLLQGFLVLLARRVGEHAAASAAHAAEREDLLQRAVSASQEERRRIARDVHDGVVQELAAVALDLGGLAARTPQLADELRVNAGALHDAGASLRSLIVALAPPDLSGENLVPQLETLVDQLRRRGVAVTVVGGVQSIDAAAASVLFRGCQELLRNVTRHSEAATVLVRLRTRDGRVELSVEDDGRGHDAAERARRREEGHVGLELTADLMATVGGGADIRSVPGEGTVATLWVPVSSEPPGQP